LRRFASPILHLHHSAMQHNCCLLISIEAKVLKDLKKISKRRSP
jgi:hypothetical protein